MNIQSRVPGGKKKREEREECGEWTVREITEEIFSEHKDIKLHVKKTQNNKWKKQCPEY